MKTAVLLLIVVLLAPAFAPLAPASAACACVKDGGCEGGVCALDCLHHRGGGHGHGEGGHHGEMDHDGDETRAAKKEGADDAPAFRCGCGAGDPPAHWGVEKFCLAPAVQPALSSVPHDRTAPAPASPKLQGTGPPDRPPAA